jgi:hypothetical protein
MRVYSVVAAGAVRTYYLGITTSSELDTPWYGFDVYAASVAECNIAIMCACAPSLTCVTGRFFRSMSSPGSNKDTGGFGNDDGDKGRKRGISIQLMHFMKILTGLIQISIQGLNQTTALPLSRLHHRDQIYLVTCQYASRNVQPT